VDDRVGAELTDRADGVLLHGVRVVGEASEEGMTAFDFN
jgi:hypothetical protein